MTNSEKALELQNKILDKQEELAEMNLTYTKSQNHVLREIHTLEMQLKLLDEMGESND